MFALAAVFAGSLIATSAPATPPAGSVVGIGDSPYPARAVRIIAAQQPGSAADHVARAVADALADHWSAAVVVDNRPGASGAIGTQVAARAAPDGHTLLIGGLTNIVTSPILDTGYGVDPEADLTPIGRIARVPFVLAASANAPISTLDELVGHARARPGELVFATSGPTAFSRIALDLVARAYDLELLTVEYRGAPAATLDLVAGRAHLQVNEVATMKQHADAGRIRPLAIAGDRRASAMPAVPTLGESSSVSIPFTPWYGLFAPAGLPQELVARLDAAYQAASRDPKLRARLEALGYEPVADRPGEFATALRRDLVSVREMARRIGRVPAR